MRKSLSIFLVSAIALISSCGPSSNIHFDSDGESFDAGGSFFVEGSNVLDGMFWQLNRPIRMTFNHPLDPDSVNFGTVLIRPTDPGAAGTPVTGVFEIEEGSGGRALIFSPTCPTNDDNSDGAFRPGNFEYELVLPSRVDSPTVLRDTTGNSLSKGLRRVFYTPALSQPLFLDLVAGPPRVTELVFPTSLNLFADPNPVVSIVFNQAVDARSSNLNSTNLTMLYADGEIGTAAANTYPETNVVPGQLRIISNCTLGSGAHVEFVITGIMPVNRNIQLQMSTQFRDLSGQRNAALTVLGTHGTPTLASIYNDPSWNETDETVDEFRDDFDTTDNLNLSEPLPLPLAQIQDGFLAANFEYPGAFVSDDVDFFLSSNQEIFTDSQTTVSDSNNRVHTVQNGVLNVHDFVIAAGATLRGRGSNPLVIYATGEVIINGTLNLSGNNANWPTSLNSPQFVEGGANGECGGGRGGDASQIGLAETPRAMNGDGPFFIIGGGGGGGEGGFNSDTNNTGFIGLNATAVGGGGGGGFAVTENVSVLWDDWLTTEGWIPENVDNKGPDHIITRHTQMVSSIGITAENPNGNGIFGAEAGIRGPNTPFNLPFGVLASARGMEDALLETSVETIGFAGAADYDPAWTVGLSAPFEFGHPTQGADPGVAGPSVFSNDLIGFNTQNDFWGTRRMSNGTVVRGELLAPWAGSGGGGSGDSMLIQHYEIGGVLPPLETLYPVVPFAKSLGFNSPGWSTYRKGAAGAGGGGQCLIMSIGMIRLGASSKLQANGGIGFSGESLTFTDQGVSGSGGGSGGHIVLHSATGLDVSAINVGNANNEGQIGNLNPAQQIQAFGGRRGWAGPKYSTNNDGNPTFGFSRGGAGANGVIQIHVPDSSEDIIWHTSSKTGIEEYINNSPNELYSDRSEEMLGLYTAPQPYSLVPFFSSQSMALSKWIDTGLAELRLGDTNSYPKFGDPLLDFSGVLSGTGFVGKTGDSVFVLPDIATGNTGDVTFNAFDVTIPNASSAFDAKFMRLPSLLVGYDVLPNAAGTVTFEVVDAAYDSSSDVLVLTTATEDSPMTFALDIGNPVWSVKEKFFRIDTAGSKDSLPASTTVRFEFQGANESVPGSGLPETVIGGPNNWVSNLDLLDGARFIRYRVTFEADAQETGVDLSSPLPVLDYVKLPIVW